MCILQVIGMYFKVYVVSKSCVHEMYIASLSLQCEKCIKKYIKVPPLNAHHMYINQYLRCKVAKNQCTLKCAFKVHS